MRIALYILICLSLAACDRPQMIPEPVLRDILRDAYINQATASHVKNSYVMTDTVDMHSPVLNRYGYKLTDLRYTIRNMSLRKSNPLPNILDMVAADIRRVSDIAQARYQNKLHIDTLAQCLTADTLYRKDTLISGRISGFKWSIVPREGDSVFDKGRYNLLFDYSTGSRASSYSKSIEYSMIVDTAQTYDGSLWLTSSKDTLSFDKGLDVDRANIKRLKFAFKERPTTKGVVPDTVYVSNIRVVRILPASVARKIYYMSKSGFIPFEDKLAKLLYQNQIKAVAKLDAEQMKTGPQIDTAKRYFTAPYEWPEIKEFKASVLPPPYE